MIGLDWLRMFSSKELSTLVAGAEHDINVSDLQVCFLFSHHFLAVYSLPRNVLRAPYFYR